MAISALYDLVAKVTTTETGLYGNVTNTVNPVVSLGTIGGTLTANSTVPATQVYSADISLVAGAATIDFSALDQGDKADIDVTGLKPQLVLFKAASTNTAVVTIKDGATTGYDIWGNATGEVALHPGAAILLFGNDNYDDVGAADDQVDLASSDVDAAIEALIVFG